MSQYIRYPTPGGDFTGFSIIQPDTGTSPTAAIGATTLTITSESNPNLQVLGVAATNTLSIILSDNPIYSSLEVSGDLQIDGNTYLNDVDLNGGTLTGAEASLSTLQLNSAAAKYTQLHAHTAVGTSYSVYMPQNQGTGALTNDGSGNLSWSTVSGAAWGSITGTLSSQTDLQSALNAKQATGNYITALTGEVSASGPGSVSATVTNSAVLGKVLTGFSSGAGTITSSDTLLTAFNKLNGNVALKAPIAGPTFTGTITTALTPSKAVVTGASNELATATTSATEIGYVAGVTSAIQTQLDSKAAIANNQPARNYLINSAFDFWQRFGASPSQTVANTVSTYVADRWYIKNTLGTNGIITGSQVAGTTNGSKWGLSVKITTAPTAAQVNGTELYQALENIDSLNFYGQTASFGILVKALGNVTQVGVQFYYKTTEAKVDTSIGSEVLTTVNSSTFVSCSTLGQAIGTSQTTAGVIGVRVRITGVSSGNLYALNNGFIVEQGQINLGSTLGTWQRAGNTNSEELRMCQRFYQKSYDLLVAPGTASNFNGLVFTNGGVTTSASHAVNSFFKVSLRAAPTATSYDLAGTSGKYTIFDSAGTANSGFTPSGFVAGENSVYLVANAVTTPGIGCHYTVDAEI
jgi:hypothetical protein